MKAGNEPNTQINSTNSYPTTYSDTHDLPEKKVPLAGQNTPATKEGCEISL
ncbi:hypothetical protein [Rickettsia endosymbiont of Polydrusus tereticollis]|uniref:hypothetical protein n=1 Tax=Rickettsia endosymbiont of Polydrusus tereticollis TaxID=3066251 RepID=UPI0031334112